MVAQRENHLLQTSNALVGLRLDRLGFGFRSGLALLLDVEGLAEDSVFLDGALVIGLERLEIVFQARLVLFEGFNQRGLLLDDALQFVLGWTVAAVHGS